MTKHNKREVATARDNLRRLIDQLPMVEPQRNLILHAIEVLRGYEAICKDSDR